MVQAALDGAADETPENGPSAMMLRRQRRGSACTPGANVSCGAWVLKGSGFDQQGQPQHNTAQLWSHEL